MTGPSRIGPRGGRGHGGNGPMSGPDPDARVFVISVAAELSGLHPQTLRTYDRLGLVAAGRTEGGGRRYSMRDIELLQQVARLTAEGLGLPGVRRVIDLEHQVAELARTVTELRVQLEAAHRTVGTVQNLPARIPGGQVTVWKQPR